MPHKVILALAVLAASLVACAPTVVPFNPEPPRKALMKDPEPLHEIKEGDDLFEDNAKVRAAHGRVSDQVRGLQGYVRTLLKKRKGTTP